MTLLASNGSMAQAAQWAAQWAAQLAVPWAVPWAGTADGVGAGAGLGRLPYEVARLGFSAQVGGCAWLAAVGVQCG